MASPTAKTACLNNARQSRYLVKDRRVPVFEPVPLSTGGRKIRRGASGDHIIVAQSLSVGLVQYAVTMSSFAVRADNVASHGLVFELLAPALVVADNLALGHNLTKQFAGRSTRS